MEHSLVGRSQSKAGLLKAFTDLFALSLADLWFLTVRARQRCVIPFCPMPSNMTLAAVHWVVLSAVASPLVRR